MSDNPNRRINEVRINEGPLYVRTPLVNANVFHLRSQDPQEVMCLDRNRATAGRSRCCPNNTKKKSTYLCICMYSTLCVLCVYYIVCTVCTV